MRKPTSLSISLFTLLYIIVRISIPRNEENPILRSDHSPQSRPPSPLSNFYRSSIAVINSQVERLIGRRVVSHMPRSDSDMARTWERAISRHPRINFLLDCFHPLAYFITFVLLIFVFSIWLEFTEWSSWTMRKSLNLLLGRKHAMEHYQSVWRIRLCIKIKITSFSWFKYCEFHSIIPTL